MNWSTRDGVVYEEGSALTVETLPPGFYNLQESIAGLILFINTPLSLKDLIYFEDGPNKTVLNDINSFWQKRKLFEKFGFPFKRGILMSGPGGCGKTSTIIQISKEIINQGGYVFNFNSVHVFLSAISTLREKHPDAKIVAVMEDIDSIIRMNGASSILNMLDGANIDIENVVYLATTNFIDDLHDTVKNRPSRFDRLIEFGPPSLGARKAYLESLIAIGNNRSDINININLDIDYLAEKSDGLSFAHLKELFISIVCFEREAETVILELKKVPLDSFDDDTKNSLKNSINSLLGLDDMETDPCDDDMDEYNE